MDSPSEGKPNYISTETRSPEKTSMNRTEPLHFKTTVPFPVLVGEIRTMFAWCQPDRDKLIKAGLDWTLVEKLPLLCDTAEKLCIRSKLDKVQLSLRRKRLAVKFRKAVLVRTVTCARIRQALNSAGSKKTLPSCKNRRKQHEILKDLFDFSGLCDHLEKELSAIGFKPKRTRSIRRVAQQLQREMVDLDLFKAEIGFRRGEYLSSYHELYSASACMKRCALDLFPPGSPRRPGYVSRYRKSPVKRGRKQKSRQP